MGTAAKRPPAASSPDGSTDPNDRASLDKSLQQQREQSGGLTDDPTESGEPVRNKDSFKPKG